MKFAANAQDLLEGISSVSRALTGRAISPVLDGIHASLSDDTLTLIASDGTITIRWTGTVTGQESGSVILPGKMASELCRKIRSQQITVATDDTTATFSYGKSRSRMSVISGAYPEQRTITSPQTITLPACDLKSLFSHVLPCISLDDSRLILTGALMEITSDQITAVALDGFRLALKHLSVTTPVPAGKTLTAVIPRKAIQEYAKSLPATPDPVNLILGRELVSLTVGPTTISCVLLAGEFIDYHKILPATFAHTISVQKDPLQDAIDRANVFAKEGKSNLVRFDVSPDTLTVSSNSETGNAVEELDVLTHGEPISIAFNSNYIAEAIRNIPSDPFVINLTSPVTPAVLTAPSDQDWLYLILPVRTR